MQGTVYGCPLHFYYIAAVSRICIRKRNLGDSLFAIICVFGLAVGLALLLIGMKIMTNQLLKMTKAEGRKNRIGSHSAWWYLIVGTGVTAIVQSSSAVTAITISAVESGVLTLYSAVAVVAGANIGTAATAFIISFVQLGSGAVPTAAVYCGTAVALAAGIRLRAKSTAVRCLCGVIFGFCVLIIGLELMAKSMQPITQTPLVQSFFAKAANPFVGLAVGAVLTAVVQSSSATVGMLQSVADTVGSLTVYNVAAIIIGENIGTTVTGFIAAAATGKAGKKVAQAHLLMNVLGGAGAMLLVYGVGVGVNAPLLSHTVSSMDIAVIHLVFNMLCTVIYFPFLLKCPQALRYNV